MTSSGHVSSRRCQRRINERSLHTYEYTPGFVHAKVFVSEDQKAVVGTINLDYRSLYRHFENGCLLYDCQAVHDIKADFEATFPQCVEVTDQYLSVSRPVRLWQSVLRLFAVLL